LREKYAKGGKGGWKGRNDVKAELIPEWKQQRSQTWAEACENKEAIVLAFVSKKEELNTKYFVDKKAADASRENVSFVWVLEGMKQIKTVTNKEADRIKGFGEDKDKKDEAKETEEDKARREADAKILARSRLANQDLWAAYGVDKGETFIVCDWYGNEFKRFKSKPSGSSVLSAVKDVEKDIEKANKNAEAAMPKFSAAKEKGDIDAMLKAALPAINGYVGLEKVEPLAAALEEVLATQDEALQKAIDAKDTKALKAFVKKYEGTRIAVAAQDAMTKIDGKESKTAGGK
ncbi:MAG: hypothetical protein KDB07_07170, partial [Planctomycetes bacterium]|nr:hypothetical protein [Planctomycetota bacterium]